jgi:hypothetical protein
MSKQNIEDILDTNDSKNTELIKSERGNLTNANFEKIKNAGKSLKVIVKAILIMLVCFFISGFLVLAANGDSAEVEMIKFGYTLLALSSLILNIIILVNLYDAGNNLAMVESVSDDSDIKEKHISVNASRTGEIVEGGIIVQTDQNGEHGLVCCNIDLGKIQWDLANTHCEEYENEGFTDWRLPNDDELNLIYSLLQSNQLGSFHKDCYWSSSLVGNKILAKNFANGDSVLYGKKNECHFCCVRSF